MAAMKLHAMKLHVSITRSWYTKRPSFPDALLELRHKKRYVNLTIISYYYYYLAHQHKAAGRKTTLDIQNYYYYPR